MNERSETNQSSQSQWFGLDRLRLSEGEQAVDITIGSASHWDRSHLRRLRQSGDLPGMVPIIDSDFSNDGKPFAVTPVVDTSTLASLLDTHELDWADGAGVVEAAARAIHEAHLRGLFHGALAPEDVHVIDDQDVAVAGVGLGLGGVPGPERANWTAPEVSDGNEPSERSDVYSLGKMLEATLGDALESVPRSVRRLIMWSSSDTPEARPPSAMEFASILAEGLGDDRRTYGPAFIPTGNMSDLASDAGAAVTGHALSDTAQATSDASAMTGIAGSTVAAAAAFLAGNDADAMDDGVSVTDADAAGSIGDVADADDFDPGTELDDTDEISLEPETEHAAALGSSEGSNNYDSDRKAATGAAAETVEVDRSAVTAERRNWAGIAVGVLLALGLAGIIWGIIGSGDDGDDDAASSSSSAIGDAADDAADAVDADVVTNSGSTDDDDAATDADETADSDDATDDETTASGSDTDDTTDTDDATAAGSDTDTDTDDATDDEATAGSDSDAAESDSAESDAGSETDAAPASPAATATGPIAMSDARVQVLHGIPGEEVDVYVDGEAVATGFTSGTIAGPVDLDPGSHEIQLFSASSDAPAALSDRSDDAIMSGSIDVGSSPESVIAHLDEAGQPTISTFSEPMETLEPGQGRLIIRHLMAAGPAEARVDGTAIGTLSPGQELAADLDAGSVMVELVSENGTVLGSATVALDDGELASLAAIGAPGDGTAEIVAQRYDGLSSAPAGVPTGNSGLLDVDRGQTGLQVVYAVMAILAVSGAAIALRRRRLS